jgi:hypothetical protein
VSRGRRGHPVGIWARAEPAVCHRPSPPHRPSPCDGDLPAVQLPPGPAPRPGRAPPPVVHPDHAAQAGARSDPGWLVAGLVIAGLGLFFLAGQLEPDIGRFVTLVIGLGLLAVFVVTREYGFLVPGSILTGVGIGVALEPATNGAADSGVMMLALAGGFLGIWLLGSLYRLPQNHWWPLIPGGILRHRPRPGQSQIIGALRLWPSSSSSQRLVLGGTLTRHAPTRGRAGAPPPGQGGRTCGR